jgi:hypothetical protein
MLEKYECVYFPKFECPVQKWMELKTPNKKFKKSILDKIEKIPENEMEGIFGGILNKLEKKIENMPMDINDTLSDFCAECPHKEYLSEKKYGRI